MMNVPAPSFRNSSSGSIEWIVKSGLSPYLSTMKDMEDTVERIIHKAASRQIWLLEHPSLYTLGTSAKHTDILDSTVPAYHCGRGGQVTYHGPGQRVIYIMLDLRNYGQDLRAFVHQLEKWIVLVLHELGIKGYTHPKRIGIWVDNLMGQETKIAAIGLRVRKWITFHGICFNICPDLEYYQGIVPCGLRSYGVTSLKELGIEISLEQFDKLLQATFKKLF